MMGTQRFRSFRSTMPPMQWKAGGLDVKFPFTTCDYSGGNRLAPRERYQRPGAKVDTTGEKAGLFTVTIRFFNGNKERGIDDGDAQYPDVLLRLIAALKIQETGTLHHPTYGIIRCKADHWEVKEGADETDLAVMTIFFMEDNEEEAGQVFLAPSARSIIVPLAQDTVVALSRAGVWSPDVVNLLALASKIESLGSAPGDYIGELEETAEQFQAAVDRIERAFGDTGTKVSTVIGNDDRVVTSTMLLKPRESAAGQSLRKLSDVAAQATTTIPGVSRPRVLIFPDKPMSLMELAVLVGQPIADLLALNPRIEEPAYIPPKTPIRINASSVRIHGAVG